MKDQFQEISEQIHELRNFLSPLDLRLENLGHQVEKSRLSFELKTAQLESRVAEHSAELAHHSEQIRELQQFLKMASTIPPRVASPVREDKLTPPGISLDPTEN